MICEKCGEPIAQDALYCENCGARAALQADAAQERAQARSASARKSMPLDEGGSRNRKIRRRRMLPGPGGSAAAQSVKNAACRPSHPAGRYDSPDNRAMCGYPAGPLRAGAQPCSDAEMGLCGPGQREPTEPGACGTDPHGRVYRASIVVLAAVTFAVSMGLVSVGGVV